jgi:hypothetical protein
MRDSCVALGCSNKLPFFRVNTNNHLESFFGKLKTGVISGNSLSECVTRLLDRERTRENDLRFDVDRVGTLVNENYHDAEMKTVLRFTTHFVAANIEGEYAAARNKASSYAFALNDSQSFADVQGQHTKNRVDLTTWACSCPFSINMKLPCRHAIAYRCHAGIAPLIPPEAVHVRYVLQISFLRIG